MRARLVAQLQCYRQSVATTTLNESSRVYGPHGILSMEILRIHSYQNTSDKVTKVEWMNLFLHNVYSITETHYTNVKFGI
jgi:hypothetical protein